MNHEQELTLRRQLIDTAIANTGTTNLSKGWVIDICRARDFDGNEHTGYLIDDHEYGFNLYEFKNGRPPVITPVDPTTAERVGSAQWCLDLKNGTCTARQLYQEISPTVIDCCFQLSQEA